MATNKVFALSINRDTGTLHVTDAETDCNKVLLGWHIIMQGSEKEVIKRANRYKKRPERAAKYLEL